MIQENQELEHLYDIYDEYYNHELQKSHFIAKSALYLRKLFKKIPTHKESSGIVILYILLYKKFVNMEKNQLFNLEYKINVM